MLDDEVPNPIKLADLYNGDKTASVFDVISELYNFVTFNSNSNTNIGGGPAIISSANLLKPVKSNDGMVIKRMFTLQPLSHLTAGFYEKLREGAEDLSQYVTEEFIIGDAASANALNTNFIDNYALLSTNYDDVMSKKWIDYTLSEVKLTDPTVHIQTDVAYEDVKYSFSKEILDGAKPNLPDRSQDVLTSNPSQIMTAQIKKRVSDDNLTKQYVQNAMKKSFVLDNIALTFTVPGNPLRKTGKFIKIKSKELKDKTNEINSKAIDGYWFIILLKHVFNGDYYTNEYTCVKLHVDGSVEPPSFVDQANMSANDLNASPIFNILNGSEQSDPTPYTPTANYFK
jgi:hypothetical protein